MPNRSLSISLARFAPSFFFLSLSLSSHLCRHQFPFLTKILYLLFNPFFKVILLLLSSPKISPFFFFRSSELSNLIWILKFFSFLSISCSGQVLFIFLRMSLDSVKVMEQSNKPNESEKKKKRKKQKKNNVRNNEEEEEEANGCWVKFRVMVCCLPSTTDVDSSSPTLSTTTRMPSFLPSLCSIWFCN